MGKIDPDTRPLFLYISLFAAALFAFMGALVYFMTSSGQDFREEVRDRHQQAIFAMHSVVIKAQLRCKALEQMAPELMADFNPFAARSDSNHIPEAVYEGEPKGYMEMLSNGYHSLQSSQSVALMAVKGNLFPVQGSCGKRLSRVDYGLYHYGTTGENHE